MTDVDHAAIQARLDAATPGPWIFILDPNYEDVSYKVVHGFEFFGANIEDVAEAMIEEDAEFIANARPDLTALLAENARLRGDDRNYTEGLERANADLLAENKALHNQIEEAQSRAEESRLDGSEPFDETWNNALDHMARALTATEEGPKT